MFQTCLLSMVLDKFLVAFSCLLTVEVTRLF
jgi:hypothetical protein